MNNITTLKDRSILEISGVDRVSFLQGLVSNDVTKASPTQLIYAAMLNATGRFLYDFFIFDDGEKLLLDCLSSRRDEIFKKLNFYKLKSQVKLEKNDVMKIYFSDKKISDENIFQFDDPRLKNFGVRIYAEKLDKSTASEDSTKYNFHRITKKIAEGEQDLTYEKSIIAEFNFDDLNAVDYKKGCYIGQELTARTHYMGQVRKKVFHIKINPLSPSRNVNTEANNDNPAKKGDEISCAGKNLGVVLSSVFYENEFHALALLKIDEETNTILTSDSAALTVNDQKIIIVS